MENLFTIWPSNAHQAVFLSDSTSLLVIASKLSRSSLLERWQPIEFDVQDVDKRGIPRPEIAICTSGWFVFPEAVWRKLFPLNQNGLEFLPISVGGQQWLLLNCMNCVEDFDAQNSQVLRGLSGEICLVLKLHVTDPMARGHEIFTLTSSNRMQLFVTETFRKRVELTGLGGVIFKPVGQVV